MNGLEQVGIAAIGVVCIGVYALIGDALAGLLFGTYRSCGNHMVITWPITFLPIVAFRGVANVVDKLTTAKGWVLSTAKSWTMIADQRDQIDKLEKRLLSVGDPYRDAPAGPEL